MSRLSARETFREYAASVGCTTWDEDRKAFYAPDRSRRVAFSESFPDRIYVRDSGLPLGKASISRERRMDETNLNQPVTQSMETGGGASRPQSKVLPTTNRERVKTTAPVGQLALSL
jgi:hypothetical protein